ncbi:ferrichrome ABC transporter permease, partial [Streptomyces sp. PGLac3x]
MRIGSAVALPVRRISVVVALVLLVLTVLAAVATLSLGRLGIPLNELPGAVFGGAEGKNRFVLGRLRGPRQVAAQRGAPGPAP